MLPPCTMKRATVAVTFSMCACLAACGSSGSQRPGTGGMSGTGGDAGHASGGAPGNGGHGSGGAGTGGSAAGGNASAGMSGQAGQQGSGGAAGSGAAGGSASGHGGSGATAGATATGGIMGSGGAAGAAGGGSGQGGAGGTSPCQAVLALDRSCQTASDCFAAVHQTNCCGQRTYRGIRTSAQAAYAALEPQCEQTYPACGCAAFGPTTDDGPTLKYDGTPSVACVQGVCTTYLSECGAPCASGTTCFSCPTHTTTYGACTTMCTGNDACHDPALPLCQSGPGGNTQGTFCTASDVACGTR